MDTQLKANDELTREIAAERVYAGWTDALDFEKHVGKEGLLPTFKMQRGRRYRLYPSASAVPQKKKTKQCSGSCVSATSGTSCD